MRAIALGVAVISLLCEVAHGQQPSFNCTTAKTASARLICSDPELSNADGALGKAFQGVVGGLEGDAKKAKIQEQIKWIRERNTRCLLDGKQAVAVGELVGSKPCMLSWIKIRIGELGRSQAVPSTPVASTANTKQSLSQDEINALRTRLTSLWNIQGGVDRPEELIVEVRIRLTAEKRLAAMPEIVSRGTSPRYQAAADAAVRAVLKGQPYDMLRDGSHDAWQDMVVTFDPRQTTSSQTAAASPLNVDRSGPVDSGRGDDIRGIKLGMRAGHLPSEFNAIPIVQSPEMPAAYRMTTCTKTPEDINSCVNVFFDGTDPNRPAYVVWLSNLRLGSFSNPRVAEDFFKAKYGPPTYPSRPPGDGGAASRYQLWHSFVDITGVNSGPGLALETFTNPEGIDGVAPGYKQQDDILLVELDTKFGDGGATYVYYASIVALNVRTAANVKRASDQKLMEMKNAAQRQEFERAPKPRF